MKRSGLEWAIVALIVLDVVLLAAFLVLHITDTRLPERGANGSASHIAAPVVTDARAPEDAALPAGEAEQILGAGDAHGRAAQGTLTVDGAQVEATLVTGTFSQRGGPDFSLYIDSAAFRLTENEGRCYVAADGNAGAKLYLELAYLPNTDVSSVAPTLLNSYGAVSSESDSRTEAFGGYSAVHVTGSSAETDLEAYVVSVGGGCLTAVLCIPGSSGADAQTLRASLDSLILG